MNEERPIEKLLRRYAKKRGEEAGDPLEMHPATRRMLQGEVARKFPKAGDAKKGSVQEFLSTLMRRWAVAAGVLLVLCTLAVFLLPSFLKQKQAGQLSLNRPSEKLALETMPVAAPLVADELARSSVISTSTVTNSALGFESDRAVTLNNDQARENRALAVLDDSASARRDGSDTRKEEVAAGAVRETLGNLPALAPGDERRRSFSSPLGKSGDSTISLTVASKAKAVSDLGTTVAFDDGLKRDAQPTTGSMAPAAVPASTFGRSVEEKKFYARGGGVDKVGGEVFRQAFSNTESIAAQIRQFKDAKDAAAQIVPVLANFQVEQSGNQLRVIDGDGSTYHGEINEKLPTLSGSVVAGSGGGNNYRSMDLIKNAVSSDLQGSRASGMQKQSQAQEYEFRVEGTNRTLNQNVVFAWNYVEMTNVVATNTFAASQMKALNTINNIQQDKAATKMQSQFPAMFQNSVINGRAHYGPGKELEINAVPVTP